MPKSHHSIISGGASGLGHGIAQRLLRRGESVSVLDLVIEPARREALDKAAETGGAAWQFQRTDVTEPESLNLAVRHAVARFGRPQLALNCAGIAVNQSVEDTSVETFQRLLLINTCGSFNFAKAVLPHMPTGGRLALIASMAGIIGNYGYAAYGSSKFGVVGLASVLRCEYEPQGINISCICPPEVKTPMVEAEHAHGNPVSLELKQVAGSLDLDSACEQILSGLDRGKWMIIPGLSAKGTALAVRLAPNIVHRISQWLIRRIMRRHGLKAIN